MLLTNQQKKNAVLNDKKGIVVHLKLCFFSMQV